MGNILQNVTNDVAGFYGKFDEAISEIDRLFDRLDEEGDVENTTIEAIVEKLLAFQEKCYFDRELSSDDNKFQNILEKYNSVEFDLIGVLNIVKELQIRLHDLFILNADWDGQRNCIDLITGILKGFKQFLQENKCADAVRAQELVRILRELVADSAISIRGLVPLCPWSYGTDKYSVLSANEQVMLLINQAILIDRMYFSMRSLRDVLQNVNILLEGFSNINWEVYYAAGLLNFKIHQYKYAKMYFEKIQNNSGLKLSTSVEEKKKYFHSNLLIAYCNEYSGEFSDAIEVLSVNVSQLKSILDGYRMCDIAKDDVFCDIMDKICEASKKNSTSLFGMYFDSFSAFKQYATQYNDVNNYAVDNQFEVLHALAHCMNEYAIKCKAHYYDGKRMSDTKNESDDGDMPDTEMISEWAKIISLARKLMETIAHFKPDYWTCYATIHGEYQDYHKALDELEAIDKRFRDANVQMKETVAAEICFFKYYFGLLINRSYDEDKNNFELYYQKFDDDDAKCHLKIFEFKEELRRAFAEFFHSISDAQENGEKLNEDNTYNVSPELAEMYKQLCGLEPTLYMNVNVRAELRLVQRAYDCLLALRDYIILSTNERLQHFENMCQRFSIVKKDMGISFDLTKHEEAHLQEKSADIALHKTLISSVSDIITKTFSSNKESIFSCLCSSDSIFILAPISGIIVYQYQTGNIKSLFTEKTVLPQESSVSMNETQELIDYLGNSFINVSIQYGQTIVDGINWDELYKYSSVVYYWNEKTASQIVVTTRNDSYIRRIKDEKAFASVIDRFAADRARTSRWCFKNVSEECVAQKVRIQPWTEIINENDNESLAFIIWDKNSEPRKLYLISLSEKGPAKDKSFKHRMHECVNRAEPRSSNQTIGKVKSFSTVETLQNGISNETATELSERIKLLWNTVSEQRLVYMKKLEGLHDKKSETYAAWKRKVEECEEKTGKLFELLSKVSTSMTVMDYNSTLNQFQAIEKELTQ